MAEVVTERKKAVLVGINYIGKSNELLRCISDTQLLEKFLISKGFECLLINDNSTIPAKKKSILDNLSAALSTSSEVYFHFSGHIVAQKEDKEGKGLSNKLLTLDEDISDVELQAIIAKAKCPLIASIDACQSATTFNLPYNFFIKNYPLPVDKKETKKGECMLIMNANPSPPNSVILFSSCNDKAQIKEGIFTSKLISAFSKCTTADDILNNISENSDNNSPYLSLDKYRSLAKVKLFDK